MSRIEKIRKLLKEQDLDALFVTNESNIFYLTGISSFSPGERDASVLLTKHNLYLFTDARYTEALKNNSAFTVCQIRSKSEVFSQVNEKVEQEKIKTLGFEEENILLSEFMKLQKEVKVNLFPTVDLIEDIRLQKDEKELQAIQKACDLTDKAFQNVLSYIKEGVTEQQLAFEIEFFIKENDGDLAFPSIVAFGKNAAVPHHETSQKKLSKTDHFVLFDIGAKVDNYCADLSRTVFLGKAGATMKKIYETTLSSQLLAIEKMNSKNIKISEIDNAAQEVIQKKEFERIPHALGHGVGIDVHELPVIARRNDNVLQKGAVITVEPGIYVPNLGGVRIEDTIYYDGEKPHLLTHSTNDLIEL
jgi:Xaa-Pro aminopeptidase